MKSRCVQSVGNKDSISSGAAPSRRAKNDLFKCCSVIAEHGFAATLLVSPRTLTLFARLETEFPTRRIALLPATELQKPA